MTIGVGGSSFAAELAKMESKTRDMPPIESAELQKRVAKAQAALREQGLQALYLDTSTGLQYFTGITLKPSERLHGAVIPAEGEIAYLSPAFEEPKTRTMLRFGDDVRVWEEHEDPTALVIDTVRSMGYDEGTIAIDPAAPFFTVDGMRKAGNRFNFTNGKSVTAACRMLKSATEIALMQRAMNITLEVHKTIARCLYEGVTTTEVREFLIAAHQRLGMNFSGVGIVLFGEPTAYPHGVPYPQTLKKGDMVLVDMVGDIHGYRSDLTRTYVFGEPTDRQREVWNLERKAQFAAFDAAKLGAPCESVDIAARGVITAAGFGPDYATPGLPHRTGHGIGLDTHEEPYMVRGDKTPLAPGMCFSIEPMICIYGEFGVRLEDHVYMTETGPRWFTEPSHSIDDPFGYEA